MLPFLVGAVCGDLLALSFAMFYGELPGRKQCPKLALSEILVGIISFLAKL